MRKQKYYYKFVEENGEDEFFSWFVGSILSDLSVEYKIGKWVKPKLKGSKLFVFDTFKHAREWSSCELLFKCEVKNSREKRRILFGEVNVLAVTKNVENFWKGKKMFNKKAPKGTYVCDAVKLIKEVQ